MQAQNTNTKPTRQELKTAYALWETANATFYATDCNVGRLSFNKIKEQK